MTTRIPFLLLLLTAAGTHAQEATFSPESVAEVVGFLASDEMAGRDSPSPGLERAADYIAERFEKAGLVPGGAKESWFHHYELDGSAFETKDVSVVFKTASGDVTLKGDADVRILRGARSYEVTDAEDFAILALAEASAKGFYRGRPVRQPLFLVVKTDDALWKSRGRRVESLGGRRSGRRPSPPVMLIREGAVPENPTAVSIRVPEARKIKVNLRNVVGLLPGATMKDEHVVVSAHYDHVGVGLPRGGDSIYNGADDDATGTTAVVLLAEALAKREKKLPRTVAFVAFSAEEKGLRGSREFVKTCPWPLEKTASNLNIEMIGRPQRGKRNAAWMTGADLSDFRDVVTPALKRAGLEVIPFRMADRLFGASDNASFARRGVVAHSISAGSLHNDYHQPSDEVGRLDLEHMANVIRGLYEATVALASTERKLAYNEKGRKRLRLD